MATANDTAPSLADTDQIPESLSTVESAVNIRLQEPRISAARHVVQSMEDTTSELETLRDDISKLIAPWCASTEKPPFTPGEMVVFAITFSDKDFVSTDEIHAFILRRFLYYNDLAITEYASHTEARHNRWLHRPAKEVIEGFPGVLRDFDLPVVTNSGDYYNRGYQIAPSAARVYLRRWFEPERKGIFRFLDLSAELRNKIYAMVLKFPDAGLTFSGSNKLGVARAVHVSDKHTEPMPKLLAILRTCKQIHREASPLFYGINELRFDNLKAVRLALGKMSSDTKKQLRRVHIVMQFVPQDRAYRRLRKVGRMLHELSPTSLRLTLIDHRAWFSIYNLSLRGRAGIVDIKEARDFSEIDSLNHYVTLARRAESVQVYDIQGAGFENFIMGKLAAGVDAGGAGACEKNPILLE